MNAGVTNQMPVVLTEWGHAQTAADYATVYSTCLKTYLTSIKGGWMVWVLSGSYYIRSGTQDFEETWGKSFCIFRYFMVYRWTQGRRLSFENPETD